MQGLSTQRARELFLQYGPNQIPEKSNSILLKLLGKFISPISFMLLSAALLSLFIGKVFDFYFILFLLLLNSVIALWQENKADEAIKTLNEHLSQTVKIFRDGSLQELDSKFLVPGDIISLSSGELVPSDGVIIEANHLSVDESALTGESLPKDKQKGDEVFSGSFIAGGITKLQVTRTGRNTNFGKTVLSVEGIKRKSLLERDILNISKFLTFLSLGAVLILTIVFLLQKAPFIELATLDLSLLIAGIPISLPTVMTLIIEFGVLALARKKAIVRRLSALEDLANVNFLLTDKTGTLTKNEIRIDTVFVYNGFTLKEAVSYAALAASQNNPDLIDEAVLQKAKELNTEVGEWHVQEFTPADSTRKRSTVVVSNLKEEVVISIGAPQVIEELCKTDPKTKHAFLDDVEKLAKKGYRSLGVAIKKGKEEKDLELVGLLSLSDTMREDAKGVVEFLIQNNIDVSIVTGDNRAIAQEISRELSLKEGKVVTKEELKNIPWNKELFEKTGAFAEILPEDKLKLVQKAKEFFIVASNGDGINDLPAIKAANVGIAVKNAVSALRATADIVLLTGGIGVIRDAIVESRKIFARLYTYSLYRISESLRLIVTIAILGIIYRVYPLTPLQIIVIALLNDIPIISLSSDRVKITNRPAKINARKRFTLSTLYGIVGILNSLILFFIVKNILNFDWGTIQTMYFLKLTISGHMLIYVAHTKERWWKFLPSKGVIWATTLTQLVATSLALTGFLMPSRISLEAVLLVWGWAFLWMQVGELMKVLRERFS